MDLLHFVIFAMGDKLHTDFVLLQKTNCLLFKTFYSLIIQQVWRLAFRSQTASSEIFPVVPIKLDLWETILIRFASPDLS